ncbi:tetratricopeptide repeat protein [bacterium]|nr:tetratricopeptide repeat protein [bacterium]
MDDATNSRTTLTFTYWGTFTVTSLIYILHVIPIFSSTPNLWGTDQWRYFPFWAQIVFIILAGISLSPKLGSFFYNNLDTSCVKLGKFTEKVPKAVKIILATLVGSAVLWLLRQRTFFLGDGYLRIKDLARGERFSVHEPFDTFIHHIVYNTLSMIRENPTQLTFAIVSVICGVVFFYVVLRFCKIFADSRELKILTLSSLLLMGSVQVFFGYAENYTILALLITLYHFYGYKSLNSNMPIHWVTLIAFFAVCTHVTGVVVLPPLLYLFIIKFMECESKRERILLIVLNIAAALIPLIILTVLARTFTGRGFISLFLEHRTRGGILQLKPDTALKDIPYGLFHPGHLLEVFNLYILIAPVIFITLPLIASVKRLENRIWNKDSIFYFISFISYFLLAFVIYPSLGMSRDWDLFSAAAIPATFLALIIIKNLPPIKLREISVMIALCLALHTVPWIVLNSFTDLSIMRFNKLVESPYWSKHARGYGFEELGNYYSYELEYEKMLKYLKKAYSISGNERQLMNIRVAHNELGNKYAIEGNYEKAVTEFKKALEIDPDFHVSLYNLGLNYKATGELEKSVVYLEKAVQINPTELKYLLMLADVYYGLGDFDRAILAYKETLKFNPQAWRVYNNLAVSYMYNKDFKSSVELLETALKMGFSDPYLYLNIGQSYMNLGNQEKAIESFRAGFNNYPTNSILSYMLGVSLLKIGRKKEGKDFLLKTLELDPNHEDAKRELEKLGAAK